MKVTVAKSSGFCFGVKNAVDTAVSIAGDKSEKRKKVLLGEIVHNSLVVKNLTDAGFEIIDNASDIPEGSLVIIRAHGVTPEEKRILRDKNCEVKDCTCPFVDKIHKIVREAAENGKNIIVTGGKGHPEVVGI